MYGYVYKTTNLVNGMIYIGQHKGDVFDTSYFGSGLLIREAFSKYGIDNFKCEVLEWCETRELLDAAEIYWIEKLNSKDKTIGYNIASGGFVPRWCGPEHPMYGKHHTKESNEKNRQSHLKIYADCPELRKQISDRQLALFASSEGKIIKQKISSTLTGKPSATAGWIYIHKDDIERKVPKDKLNEYLENGYILGRTDKQAARLKKIASNPSNETREKIRETAKKKKGGHWLVNKEGIIKYIIDLDEVNEYLNSGYVIGRKYHD